MPAGKPLGLPIIPSAVASKLVAQLPAAKTVTPPIPRGRYTRNGQHPDVALINAMNEQTNQGVLYRTKEVFRCIGPLAASAVGSLRNGILPSSSAASGRVRWRFAFHTGKYTHAIRAVACMVPASNQANANQYTTLTITNSAGDTVATANFYRGPDPGVGGGVSGGWDALRPIEQFLTLSPDTDYFGTWSELNYGRLQSACVWELSSMTEKFSGYLPQNLASGSHIVDAYRENLVTLQYNLWRRSGATVLNWVADNSFHWTTASADPISTSSLTPVNIVDGTSTVVSAATPGYTLVMGGKERVSQASTGVPCVFKAYGVHTATSGAVQLKNSAGTVLATVTGFTTTPSWQSTTVTLPATTAKYDLHFHVNDGIGDGTTTFSLHAVSIYEYEP